MKIRHKIVEFIATHQNSDLYSPLESYALSIIKEKIKNNEISIKESELIINEFLTHYLDFDSVTGEPSQECRQIETFIDFILSENKT